MSVSSGKLVAGEATGVRVSRRAADVGVTKGDHATCRSGARGQILLLHALLRALCGVRYGFWAEVGVGFQELGELKESELQAIDLDRTTVSGSMSLFAPLTNFAWTAQLSEAAAKAAE
jgi:hypothetical protein